VSKIHLVIVATILTFCFNNSANATNIIQTISVSTDNSADPFSIAEDDNGAPLGPTDLVVFDSQFFTSLGTLDEFTIGFTDLNFEVSATGAGEPGIFGGTVGLNVGGQFNVNGVVFNGAGGGDFVGADFGEFAQFSFTLPDTVQTFVPADAGVTFDPALLPLITGTDPLNINFNSSGDLNSGGNLDNIVASASGTITLEYHFTPFDAQAIPEPSTALLLMVTCLGSLNRQRRRR